MQKNQFAVQEDEDNVAAAATTDPKTKFEAEIFLETQQLWQICNIFYILYFSLLYTYIDRIRVAIVRDYKWATSVTITLPSNTHTQPQTLDTYISIRLLSPEWNGTWFGPILYTTTTNSVGSCSSCSMSWSSLLTKRPPPTRAQAG